MKKLTVTDLDAMPSGMFATGTILDKPDAPILNGSGLLRWIATRGRIHDWTIYALPADRDVAHILSYGDKVHGDELIQKLVPCSPEALALYRH